MADFTGRPDDHQAASSPNGEGATVGVKAGFGVA